MTSRLPVKKTYKLFLGGAFPRSESGRTYEAQGQNVALASRKDARDAVRAARAAQPGWAGATAYNRGQVLYRLAEMMEARAGRPGWRLLRDATRSTRRSTGSSGTQGWADKLPQVLGSREPGRGPVFQLHASQSRPGSWRARGAGRAGARRSRLTDSHPRSSAAMRW